MKEFFELRINELKEEVFKLQTTLNEIVVRQQRDTFNERLRLTNESLQLNQMLLSICD